MRFPLAIMCPLALTGCVAPASIPSPPSFALPNLPAPSLEGALLPLPTASPSAARSSATPASLASAVLPVPPFSASGRVGWLKSAGWQTQVVVFNTQNFASIATAAMPGWQGPGLPHVSADGRWLTYLTHDAPAPQVVMWDLQANQEAALPAPPPPDAREPDVSGDGRWLIYLVGDPWAPRLEIYDTRSGAARGVNVPQGQLVNADSPTLSGDGNTLAYVADSGHGDTNVYLWSLLNNRPISPPTLNSDRNDQDPALSQNGQMLLFSSDRNGKFDLFGYDLKTSQYLDMSAFTTTHDNTKPRFWGPQDNGLSFLETAAGLSTLRIFSF